MRFSGILFLLMLWGLNKFNPLLAQQAIPHSTQTILAVDMRIARYETRLQEVDNYAKHTQDSPELQKSASKFLKDFYARYFLQADAPNWPALKQQAGSLVQSKCKDPFVLQAIGIVLLRSNLNEPAENYLKESLAHFKTSTYPASCRLEGIKGLARLHKNIVLSDDDLHWTNAYSEALASWLASSDYPAEQQRIMWWEVQEFYDQHKNAEGRKYFFAACQKLKDLSPWTQLMIQGAIHEQAGWTLYETADEKGLPPEIQKQANAKMALAAKHYSAAWQAQPNFPEAATALTFISRVNKTVDETRQWFDRAVQAQMDYRPAYEAMNLALEIDKNQLYKFGLECLGTDEFETDVPYYYVQILCQLDLQTGNQGEVWKDPDAYERTMQCLDRLCKDPQRADRLRDELNLSWLRSRQAHIALLTGHEDRTRELFDQLGDNLVEDFFLTVGRPMAYIRARIYARTGSTSSLVSALAKLNGNPERRTPELWEESVALLKQIRRQDQTPQSQAYYDHWQNVYELEEKFDQGDWVDLPFDSNWWTWNQVIRGDWQLEKEGSIKGFRTSSSTMMLKTNAEFHGPLVFECDVEELDKEPFQGLPPGVVIGSLQIIGRPDPSTRLFFADSSGQRVGIAPWLDMPGAAPWKLPQVNRIRVKVADGFYSMYVNGDYIAEAEDTKFKPGRYPILSSMWWQGAGQGVRYANARVRKWEVGTPPSFPEHEKRAAYYAKELQADNTDPRAHFLYAVAKLHLKDLPTAYSHFLHARKLQNNLRGIDHFLGLCAMELNSYRTALKYFRAAEAEGTNPANRQQLALILAAASEEGVRNGTKALAMTQDLVKTSRGKDWYNLLLLAAAQAELGQFEAALKTLEQSEVITPANKSTQITEIKELFKAKTPYRLATRELNEAENALRKKMEETDSPDDAGFQALSEIKGTTEGLIWHWKLDETDGNVIQDSIRQESGSVQGKAIWKAGKVGGALYLDGKTSAGLGSKMPLSANDMFSVGGWIQADKLGRMTIVARMDDANNFRGFNMSLIEGQVYVNLVHQYPANAIQVQTKNKVTPKQWHHIMLTYDGSSKAIGVKIYVDGELQEVTMAIDTLSKSIETHVEWRLGQRSVTNPFQGLLDDMRLYNRPLSQTEVQTLFREQTGEE